MTVSTSFPEQVQNCARQLAETGVSGLSALYDLTALRLVRYAVTITRHQHDADDAVQSALVRVATRPRLLTSADCAWAYLLRMVRNEALLICRRQQRCSLSGSLGDLLTRRLVDEVEREETHRAIWMALRELPSQQAEVVVLKIWEEMTFAQIGELLDVSPHTAASRYQYAIRKLAGKLTSLHREVCHG